MGKDNIVATCHVKDCMWWQQEHCKATQIDVEMVEDHADCITYKKKEGEM